MPKLQFGSSSTPAVMGSSAVPVKKENVEFAHVESITYSVTTDFRYRDENGERTIWNNANSTYETTKTITWMVGSNSPITHGYFLDGSPWVIDNGDLYLLRVTPEPGIFTDNAPFSGKDWETNHTVINPDMGRSITEYTGQEAVNPTADVNNWPADVDFVRDRWNTDVTQDSGYERTTPRYNDSRDYAPRYMFPLDGRSGITGDKEVSTTGAAGGQFPGAAFNREAAYQRWDRNQVKLNNNDMVVSAISHTDSKSNNYWGGYWRECLYDILSALTVVDQDRSNFFRPPVNWDVNDLENRPFFEERDDLENYNFSYPTVGLKSATPDWGTAKVEDWFDMSKRFSTNDNATPLRLGGMRILPGGTEHDDTVQGWTRSMDVTFVEYGSWEALDIEAMYMLGFDSTYGDSGGADRAKRDKVRRALTQRGIDIYGGFRSLGKWNSPNGGHSEPYDWYLLFAMLTTKAGALNTDLKNLHDTGIVGNAANGTLKGLDDYDTGLANIGSNLGQLYHIDDANDPHAGRIHGLDIDGIGRCDENGIEDAGGAFYYVDVVPPLSTRLGQGNPHTRISHYAGNDDRTTGGQKPGGNGSQGRWGVKNNQSEINRSGFQSYYLRGDNGRISRIIENVGKLFNEDETANAYDNGAYGGNWFTDRTQRMILQDPIGASHPFDGVTKVDLSPFVNDDITADRLYFHAVNYSAQAHSLSGSYNYTWTGVRQSLMVPFAAHILQSQAGSGTKRDALPTYWKIPYDRAVNLFSDIIALNTVEGPSSSSGSPYQMHRQTAPFLNADPDYSWSNLWRAFIREYTLDGVEPQIGKSELGGDAAWKQANWPAVNQATANWPVIDDSPFLPGGATPATCFIEDPGTEINGGTKQVENPDGTDATTGGVLQRFGRIVLDDGRDGFTVQSKVTRSLNYTTYVNGKTLYCWPSGAGAPIAFEKISDTFAGDDEVWIQEWAMPSSIGTWPNAVKSYSAVNSFTFFYA